MKQKRTPQIYTVESLQGWPDKAEFLDSENNRIWAYKRPKGFNNGHSLRWRCIVAYRVFTGRYDALKWRGQEDNCV